LLICSSFILFIVSSCCTDHHFQSSLLPYRKVMTECTKWIKQQTVSCKLHGRTADDKWWDTCRILTNPEEARKTPSSTCDWLRVRSIRHGKNPQLGHQDLLEAERRLTSFCPESFTRTDGSSFCDERPLKRPCNGSNTGRLPIHLQQLCRSHIVAITVRVTRETFSWKQACGQHCESHLLKEMHTLQQQMNQVVATQNMLLHEIRRIREDMQNRDTETLEERDTPQLLHSPEEYPFIS
jgi:hypothetical protein